jgi:hypothetical protein
MTGTKKVVSLRRERFKRNIIKCFISIKRSIYNTITNKSDSSSPKSKKDANKSGKAKNK